MRHQFTRKVVELIELRLSPIQVREIIAQEVLAKLNLPSNMVVKVTFEVQDDDLLDTAVVVTMADSITRENRGE